MDKLSTEILSSIFEHLPILDKVECTLVCKKWQQKISKNNLYSTLSADDVIFNNSLTFFSNNREFGAQVRELSKTCLERTEVQDLSKLKLCLSLFPNIRRAYWNSEYQVEGSLPYENTLKVTQGFWRYIEELTVKLPVSWLNDYLFDTGHQYTKLKYLNVSFIRNFEFDKLRVYNHNKTLSKLISNLCTAPALETLILKNAIMSLNQLESLHNHAPSLKELTLIHTYIRAKVHLSSGVPLTETSSKLLNSFSISISTDRPVDTPELDLNTINQWLNYVGRKYTNLQRLDIKFYQDEEYPESWDSIYESIEGVYDNDGSPLIKLFEKPIIELLSNIKSLEIYGILLSQETYPSIFQAMNLHNIQLKCIHWDLINLRHDPTKLLSTQIESLQEVVFSQREDSLALMSLNLFDDTISFLINQFSNLTSLKFVNCFITFHSSKSLIDILENVKTLKSLSIDQFREASWVGYDGPFDLKDTRINEKSCKLLTSDKEEISLNKNTTHHKKKTHNLKSLSISRFELSEYKKSNSLFSKVLEICCYLETFALSGKIQTYTPVLPNTHLSLDLDFLNNPQLKSVTINVDGIDFYKFNNIPEKKEKYWRDFYQQQKRTTCLMMPGGISRSINLSWKGKLKTLNLRRLHKTL